MEFPRCNNTGIEWYRRMPRNLPLVDPQDKKAPEQCEKGDATLEATHPITDNRPSP